MSTGWEQVYSAHYRRLVALVAALSGSRVEAEEAVQEAFVRALGLTGHRAVVEEPEAWLYRVAVNVIRSRARRVTMGRRLSARVSDRHELVDGGVSDSRLDLLNALRRLPFAQREALVLHYLADLPVEAIAVRVGSPVGTVKARLSRGRDALARLMGEPSSEAAKGVWQ